VHRHRICDRFLLLHLRLVATIIPLANARRQVVDVDVVDAFVIVFVVVDVVVVRRRAVAVVAIVVIVVIVIHRAIAVAIPTVAVAIFIDVVVCCAVTVVTVIVRRAFTLVVDAIVHRTLIEKEAKSHAALLCHPLPSPCPAESCVRTVKSTNAMF
jgi:hypothetical protein